MGLSEERDEAVVRKRKPLYLSDLLVVDIGIRTSAVAGK